MTTWTSDELNKIGMAEELRIASLRPVGVQRMGATRRWLIQVCLLEKGVLGKGILL